MPTILTQVDKDVYKHRVNWGKKVMTEMFTADRNVHKNVYVDSVCSN